MEITDTNNLFITPTLKDPDTMLSEKLILRIRELTNHTYPEIKNAMRLPDIALFQSHSPRELKECFEENDIPLPKSPAW